MNRRRHAMPEAPLCPYCHVRARLEPASIVYGPKWAHNWLWVCGRFPICDAFVGCHPGSKVPLGTPANKELRDARSGAHAAFDALWRSKIKVARGTVVSRGYAYHLLAGYLKTKVHQTHIGMFDLAQCAKVLSFAKEVKAGTYPQSNSRSATQM